MNLMSNLLGSLILISLIACNGNQVSSLSIADELSEDQKDELLKEDSQYEIILVILSMRESLGLDEDLEPFRDITYKRLFNFTFQSNDSVWVENLRQEVTSNSQFYLESLIDQTEDTDLIEKYNSSTPDELVEHVVKFKLKELDPLVYQLFSAIFED